MQKLLSFLIIFYQKTLSPDKGFLVRLFFPRASVCVFYPTCSEYSKKVFEKHGFFKGFFLSLRRIARCHPWQKNHIDIP